MSWSHLVILGLVTGSASLTAWPDHHIWPKPRIFLGPAGFMQISFFSRTLSWYIKLPRAWADRSPPTRKIHIISHQVVVWIWHVGNSVTEGVRALVRWHGAVCSHVACEAERLLGLVSSFELCSHLGFLHFLIQNGLAILMTDDPLEGYPTFIVEICPPWSFRK
jgi:hypothetical protein